MAPDPEREEDPGLNSRNDTNLKADAACLEALHRRKQRTAAALTALGHSYTPLNDKNASKAAARGKSDPSPPHVEALSKKAFPPRTITGSTNTTATQTETDENAELRDEGEGNGRRRGREREREQREQIPLGAHRNQQVQRRDVISLMFKVADLTLKVFIACAFVITLLTLVFLTLFIHHMTETGSIDKSGTNTGAILRALDILPEYLLLPALSRASQQASEAFTVTLMEEAGLEVDEELQSVMSSRFKRRERRRAKRGRGKNGGGQTGTEGQSEMAARHLLVRMRDRGVQNLRVDAADLAALSASVPDGSAVGVVSASLNEFLPPIRGEGRGDGGGRSDFAQGGSFFVGGLGPLSVAFRPGAKHKKPRLEIFIPNQVRSFAQGSERLETALRGEGEDNRADRGGSRFQWGGEDRQTAEPPYVVPVHSAAVSVNFNSIVGTERETVGSGVHGAAFARKEFYLLSENSHDGAEGGGGGVVQNVENGWQIAFALDSAFLNRVVGLNSEPTGGWRLVARDRVISDDNCPNLKNVWGIPSREECLKACEQLNRDLDRKMPETAGWARCTAVNFGTSYRDGLCVLRGCASGFLRSLSKEAVPSSWGSIGEGLRLPRYPGFEVWSALTWIQSLRFAVSVDIVNDGSPLAFEASTLPVGISQQQGTPGQAPHDQTDARGLMDSPDSEHGNKQKAQNTRQAGGAYAVTDDGSALSVSGVERLEAAARKRG
uniref:Uncharacterized protein n=1 Tax=Chromera velia CCMP2878 TaxID=1169474 RepID=A0A0G4I6P9_9ALVE|eukprot:Cvel_11436.t1-p1 / transcript=Cvel_11436.t1 / gene=Cvel_11436 / organism=Chromera_velia_CCMP2878 / gene_product=hypothetical protein / transcript_product=hypothetical protein / location=Cvel_scaffold719:38743-43557(+) / protein_length=721 / sequence_SO=supercontig / SO=protein_coding / is_pseudo=false